MTKSEAMGAILELLPATPEKGKFWTPDREEILCDSEEKIETLADFFDCLIGNGDSITGYYDPKDDNKNGETDQRTGYYYLYIE